MSRVLGGVAPISFTVTSKITDVNGEYEFSNLPPGRDTVNAFTNGFIGLTYGQTKPGASSKLVLINDEESADRIDIHLPRGGVIAGCVLDEFGNPVVGAKVTPVRLQFGQGRRVLMFTANSGKADDIGEYRLFGLFPGEYAIATTAPAVMLVPARLAEISGAAFDSEGQAVGPGSVHATPRGDQIGLPGTYFGTLNATEIRTFRTTSVASQNVSILFGVENVCPWCKRSTACWD